MCVCLCKCLCVCVCTSPSVRVCVCGCVYVSLHVCTGESWLGQVAPESPRGATTGPESWHSVRPGPSVVCSVCEAGVPISPPWLCGFTPRPRWVSSPRPSVLCPRVRLAARPPSRGTVAPAGTEVGGRCQLPRLTEIHVLCHTLMSAAQPGGRGAGSPSPPLPHSPLCSPPLPSNSPVTPFLLHVHQGVSLLLPPPPPLPRPLFPLPSPLFPLLSPIPIPSDLPPSLTRRRPQRHANPRAPKRSINVVLSASVYVSVRALKDSEPKAD